MQKEKLFEHTKEKNIADKTGVCKRFYGVFSSFVWVLSPIVVFLAMLIFFNAEGMYPFGDKTLSWCDMDQQVVPLLMNLKDILSGKEGFFFSFKNAAGMNFYGVFFFFLSSPFSLLIAFVEKSQIALFANILVALKMSVIALTSSVYFMKKNKNAAILNLFLSVLYAFSGYVMMYYQNVMWLDMVYLFPLLLLGLEKLREGKRALFTIVLTACLFANYYLSYMVVLFLLLYALTVLCVYKDKKFAVNFTLCCAVAACVSAIVWLPCLLQYFSSGRKSSIYENLVYSASFTPYQTALPTVFSVLFLFPFVIVGRKSGLDSKVRFAVWVLTVVPLVIEPINKMWQTGSYMSFPTRYAFITIFLTLTLSYDGLTNKIIEKDEEKSDEGMTKNRRYELSRYALSLILFGFAVWYCCFAVEYTRVNQQRMDQYSTTLWGNDDSFNALLALYSLATVVGLVGLVLQKLRLVKPVLLWLAIGVVALSETYVAPMTYIHSPAHSVEWHQQVMELSDRINDEEFYRVKTDKEYSGHDFDVNLMGSLGYNALGHYTSLTKDNYMNAIKKFGYTSYWMEVGNSGGTFLTDALLSVKYSISSQKSEADCYQGSYFHISPTLESLDLGIVTAKDIIKNARTRTDELDRAQFQATLGEDVFGNTDGITVYTLEQATLKNVTVEQQDKKYVVTPKNGRAAIVFNLSLTQKSTVYFNAFDEYSNALNQSINEKFTLSAPNFYTTYPTQKQNGLLPLGEYDEGSVKITVEIKDTAIVKELGLVVLENEIVQNSIRNTKSLHLKTGKNSVFGTYTAHGGECVFLSIPYDSGLRLKINGKSQPLYEVYDGFTAFYLQEGVNDIRLDFTPKGFALGSIFTAVGLGVCAAAYVLKRKGRGIELPEIVDNIAYYAWWSIGILAVVVVYAVPLLLAAL